METTFLTENGVVVTSARFMVQGQTYAVRNITSVKPLVEKHYHKISRPLGVTVFVVLIFTFTFLPPYAPFMVAVILAAIPAFLLTIMFLEKFDSVSHTYTVLLQTSSGEIKALTDTNQSFVAKVLEALNQAIVSNS
jgi:hypothetical protein